MRVNSADTLEAASNHLLSSTTTTNKKSSSSNQSFVNNDNLIKNNESIITIVTQLSGEMANNLGKIASAWLVKLHLWDTHGIRTNLVLRHQAEAPERQWNHSARANIVACFPNLRSWDFEAANGPLFEQRQEQLRQWLGPEEAERLYLSANAYVWLDPFGNLQTMYDALKRALNRQDRPQDQQQQEQEQLSESINQDVDVDISLPFLYIDKQTFAYEPLLDRYFHHLYELFAYDVDNPACCDVRAEPDEHVFHYRGFERELRDRAYTLGFLELSPNQTAYELFDGLVGDNNNNNSNKVAIASRFPSAPEHHVTALQKRGIQVRVVTITTTTTTTTTDTSSTGLSSAGEKDGKRRIGSSSNYDFCFLMSAQRELVGVNKSTFARWAAYLGNATSIRIYNVTTTTGNVLSKDSSVGEESPLLLQEGRREGVSLAMNFTNSLLRDRLAEVVYRYRGVAPQQPHGKKAHESKSKASPLILRVLTGISLLILLLIWKPLYREASSRLHTYSSIRMK